MPEFDENGKPIQKIVVPVKIGKSANQSEVDNSDTDDNTETEEEKAARLAKEEQDRIAAEEAKKKAELENQEDSINEVEIDGETYTIDENGNAIKDGNIVYTKEQLEEMSEDDDDNDDSEDDSVVTINDIAKLSGINLVDDNGNPIEYEWSEEGLAKREADVYTLGKQEGFKDGFTQYLNENPDIAAIIEYKNRFGTIEGYSNTIDYSKMSLPESEDELMNLIYAAEIQRGNPPERAKKIAEFAKANNDLANDAKLSLDYLKKNQEQEIKNRQQQIAIQEQQERQQEIAFYGVDYINGKEVVVPEAKGSLYDCIVNKGTLKNYQIPIEGITIKSENGIKKMSRKEVFDYLSKPVKEIDGVYYTQAQLDEISKINDPQEYALRCIANLNGGISNLVEKKIAEKEIKRLRSLKEDKNRAKGKVTKKSENNTGKIVLPIHKQ